MRGLLLILLVWGMSGCKSLPQSQALKSPIPIKVVIITTYEKGADTGDAYGELQHWVEEFPLTEKLPFPAGARDLRFNRESSVLGVVTGLGSYRAAATIMALGLDGRFDFSHTYWIVAGTAGVNPRGASIGSVILPEWVVDGDLAHEIDAREIPSDWETGLLPLGKYLPFQDSVPVSKQVYHMNANLVNWAYNQVREISLPDHADFQSIRKKYMYSPAQTAPKVIKGDMVSSMTFWYGNYLTQWAEKWMQYWTKGKGNFVVSAMEDAGILQALTQLDSAGKADAKRVIILRGGTDFCFPPDGTNTATGLKSLYSDTLPYDYALENVWLVGDKLARELVEHWPQYAEKIP